jgi:hypothetical protein
MPAFLLLVFVPTAADNSMTATASKHLILLAILVTATSMAADSDNKDSIHDRCRLLKVGMNYRDAMKILQREPDSTLSGHTAAEPWEGGKPPGSYGIDFWQDTLPDGSRLITQLRYSGGQVESFDCGRLQDADPTQTTPLSDNGN